MKSVSLYQLKVKLKLVDNESKYFRHAEKKYKTNERLRKVFHFCRVIDTREKARHLHLAYAYLRGIPYSRVENNPRKKPNITLLKHIVKEHTGANTDLADQSMLFRGKGFDQNVLDSLISWFNGVDNNAHLQSQNR